MPHRKMARAARRVQAFWPWAKTLSRPNSLRAGYTGQYLKTVLK